MAIRDCLKADVNIQRPVCSLTLEELMRCAESCNARWIKMVSERKADATTFTADAGEISLI
jgi:hypothetical protein